jgi:Domain of unknown function (DUF4198)
MRGAGLALAAWLCSGAALAHDSWFAPQPANERGQLVLALGTGNQYPAFDVAIPAAQLQTSGCLGPGVREVPLREAGGLGLFRQATPALLLRTGRPVSPAASVSCWAQLVPIDIQIDDPTVVVYLDEIKAPPAVRERWAALQARGVRWQETYVKHARVEVEGEQPATTATAPIEGLGLDVRLENPQRPLRAGDSVRFQVLRDGQPLAGLAVELRSDASPIGFWRQTDAEGRVQITLPLAARWILRGTDVRPSTQHPDRWESRFVTLAFEVQKKR